jgi:hypothetical protein
MFRCPAAASAILLVFRPTRDLRELPPLQALAWPWDQIVYHERSQARVQSI